MVHTNYVLSLDKGGYGFTSWQPVLECFSSAGDKKLEELKHNSSETLKYLLLDPLNPNSVKSIINKSRENARGAQDHITKEVWEQVNHIYHHINSSVTANNLYGNDALPQLEKLVDNTVLYYGVVDSTMPRNMGWIFMTMGKFIERCLITLDVADKHFKDIDYNLDEAETKDILFWRNLLLSLSGYELYLKTNTSPAHNLNVAQQVLFSKQFTRSVIYSLDRISFYLIKAVEENKPEGAEQLLKRFGRIHSRVEFADFDMVHEKGLQQFIFDVRHDLLEFNKLLGIIFFSYS
jgi:uncharacterized alpha-E superfamily protein